MADINDAADKLLEAANRLAEVSKRLDELADNDSGKGATAGAKSGAKTGPTTSVLDDANIASEKLSRSTAQSFENWTGINDQARTFAGQIFQIAGTQGIGALVNGLGKAADTIDKMTTPTNLFANLLDQIIERTIEYAKIQDKAFSNFEKQVGNVKLYQDQITNITTATATFGTSLEDTAASIIELKNSFAGFESVAKSEQSTMATTITQLSKLGIATTDLVKNMEFLVKAQGMSINAANDLQKSLYATANAMGVPPARLVSEFGKAAPALAGHGKMMTKVFLDLQNGAKNTGIAFNELLSITSKFNTFEAAADAAGQLNAVLGGDYLNSIDLLNANEGERVRILQESLKMSGKTINDMSLQQQMAAAQALGISDVTQLQKLMNNETSRRSVETIKAEKAQQQMNEVTKQAVELGDKLNSLFMKLAINMRPIIETLKDIVDYYIKWSEALGRVWDEITKWLNAQPAVQKTLSWLSNALQTIKGWMAAPAGTGLANDITFVAKGIAGLVVAWLALKAALFVVSGFASLFSTIFGGLGGVVTSAGGALTGVITSVGQAASASAKGILALGAALLMVGVGIGAAALGMASLVGAFAGLNKEQIQGALWAIGMLIVGFTTITIALILGAKAAMAGALGIGILIVAFLALGYSIQMAADGMVKIIDALSNGVVKVIEAIANSVSNVGQLLINFFNTLSNLSATHIIAISGSFVTLAGSITTLAASGLTLLGSDVPEFIIDIKNAVTGFDIDKLNKISDSIVNISVAMSKDLSSVGLIKALDKLTSSTMMSGIRSLINIISIDLTKSIKDLEQTMLDFSTTLEASFFGQFIINMNMFLSGIREMVDLLKSAEEWLKITKPVEKVETKRKTETFIPAATISTPVQAAVQITKQASDMRDYMEGGKTPTFPEINVYLDKIKVGQILDIDGKAKRTFDRELSNVGGSGRIPTR